MRPTNATGSPFRAGGASYSRKGVSNSNIFPPPPPPPPPSSSSSRNASTSASGLGIHRTASRDSSCATSVISSAIERSTTPPTRIYRTPSKESFGTAATASTSTVESRSASPGRIFRSASRDSRVKDGDGGGTGTAAAGTAKAAGHRIFRTPSSKDRVPPSGIGSGGIAARSDRGHRSEGKPPTAFPSTSRIAPERRISDGPKKASPLPLALRQRSHSDSKDNGGPSGSAGISRAPSYSRGSNNKDDAASILCENQENSDRKNSNGVVVVNADTDKAALTTASGDLVVVDHCNKSGDDIGPTSSADGGHDDNDVVEGGGNEETNMVHQSSFWDQAASAINELTSHSSSTSTKGSGKGMGESRYRQSTYSSGRSVASVGSTSASVRQQQQQKSRASSHGSANIDRRDSSGFDEDTSNMPSVSSDHPTELYSLIRAREWDGVIRRCTEDKSEAGTWVVERNTNGTIRWRLLPLHQACEMQPPEEVVKALIVAYPPAVQMKDSGGDLPLHLACRERATKDVIHTLLRADPDTAGVADDEGRLPLHLACRQGAGIDIVDDLLATHHRGAKTADSYGLLPLHWACAQNATVPIIESLLRAHPYAVDVKDKWGRTPSSLAHASTNADKDRIVAALGRDASYWTTSLKNEVESLRGRLETTSLRAKRESEKASGLEAKLAEVMAASSEAAVSFQSLRVELEDENARLREEVDELKPRIEQSDERIRYLEERNARLRDQVGVVAEKLGHLTDVFREMEDQRLQVLRVTGEWEESLHKAAELVLLDDGDEEHDEDGSTIMTSMHH